MLETIQSGRQAKPPRVLLYGVEGIGKSTLGSQAPKPIFIQTEDGLDELDCDRFPLATTFDDVVAALKTLRQELLRSADGPMQTGVEVGVFHSVTAANLLALMPELQLYGVDPWSQYPEDEEQRRPDHIQQLGNTKTLYWGLPIALRHLTINANRWHPIRLPSVKAARCFEDGELDFVFIDAEHSYDAVKADIEAWWPKVRPGGLLIGHDYDPDVSPASAARWTSLQLPSKAAS